MIGPSQSTYRSQISSALTKYGPTAAAMAGNVLTRGITGLIRGFGDYNIKSNSLMDPPQVVNSGSTGIIVRHREYIGDITSTTAFNLASYPLNPGLAETFPWLSQVADSFEQYKFRGLLFEFKSMSSDAVLSTGANSALGSVVMATQYDPLDSPFANKYQMENYQFANSAKPSLSFIHPIECAKSQTPINQLFVRNGGVPANADIRLYDLGVFNVATVGMQSTTGVIGELWITYEIELFKPKLIESTDPQELADHYRIGTPTNAAPFSGAVLQRGSTLNTTIQGNTIILPTTLKAGVFLFTFVINGTAAALTRPTLTLVNLQSFFLFDNGSVALIDNSGSTSVSYVLNFVLQLTGTGNQASVALSATGTYPTSPVFSDLVITQLPGDIVALANPCTEPWEEDVITMDMQQSDVENDDEYILSEMLAQIRFHRRQQLKRKLSCGTIDRKSVV